MRIARIELLTPDVKRFTLEATATERLPAFQAGSHVETTLLTPDGVLKRHYSLCSPQDETGYYQIAVKQSAHSRGGSRYWHERVRVGDGLQITPPIQHFSLSHQAKHHVLIAGGIGITPFVPMMLELQLRGDSFELHYAAHSPDSCAFYSWLQENFPDRCHFYFSSNGLRLNPQVLRRQRIGTHVYLCGPTRMMTEFRTAAKSFGYPYRSIHIEPFASLQDGDNQPFQVWLENRQQEVTVAAEQTLLQALRAKNIEVPYSCEAGGCGTCQVSLVHGEVEHRDFYLTEEEQAANRTIISCVSRGKGNRLVLDL